MQQFKRWTITLFPFDLTEDTKDTWRVWPDVVDKLRIVYIIYSIERCPSTGTLHVQMYIELFKKIRQNTLYRNLGPGKYIPSNGGALANITYTSKSETHVAGPYTMGSVTPTQGTRTDLIRLKDMARDGCTDFEILMEIPKTYMKYYRALDRVRGVFLQEQAKGFRKLKVMAIWGPAGTGKTRMVMNAHDPDDIFILDPPGQHNVWWDGYTGQDVLLIDDFYGWLPWSQLLRVLDGYIHRLPIKGGFTYATYTYVYITSNKHPEEWYSYAMPKELKRRINRGILRLKN